ncbi:unnamed protein product, partial [Rotaria sp. Silwood1]
DFRRKLKQQTRHQQMDVDFLTASNDFAD